MITVNNLKEQFARKFIEFELSGLKSYAKYLKDQQARSIKNDTRGPYEKYIEKEITRNDKKIKKCENQLFNSK